MGTTQRTYKLKHRGYYSDIGYNMQTGEFCDEMRMADKEPILHFLMVSGDAESVKIRDCEGGTLTAWYDKRRQIHVRRTWKDTEKSACSNAKCDARKTKA